MYGPWECECKLSTFESSVQQTMHRVLTIPEFLDAVFRTFDPSSNLRNALVCRCWSEVAFDVLWRHVDDLHRLFNLLAPLREEEEGSRQFVCYFVVCPYQNSLNQV